MNDRDKLYAIAGYLDQLDAQAGRPSGEMQEDLRRIASGIDVDVMEWLVIDGQSVRLPDVEFIDNRDGLTLGLASGRIIEMDVEPDEVDELLELIHASRS